MLTLLHTLKEQGYIAELNYQFAKFIGQKQQGKNYTEQQQNLALLLAALVSFNVIQGHTCVRLDSSTALNPFGLSPKRGEPDFKAEILQKIGQIRPLDWQIILDNHIAFSPDPQRAAPMLFQHNRLYFYRYWQAEHQLARYLHSASLQTDQQLELNQKVFQQIYPEKSAQLNWQQIAVATALAKPFSLISGGPGTGKTTTVVKLLAALQLRQLAQNQPLLKIALAAPTGKAAARLKESISNSLQQLDLPETLKQEVPSKASTIHSLLGMNPHNDLPRYYAKNPLHLDLLVVDEASMIDLFVLEKLFKALKPNTRLILLGDKDQLASVEAGNAMGELGEFIKQGYSQAHCDYLQQVTSQAIPSQAQALPAICDSLCHLRHSYRFDENSGIGQLAASINAQQAVNFEKIFAKFADLNLESYPNPMDFPEKRLWTQACVKMVVDKAVNLYQGYLDLVKARVKDPKSISVSRIFEAFQQVRLLSALRVSELGVERLNQHIAEALQQARLIRFKHSRESYFGKPIMISENVPHNQVFSGDIGLILPDDEGKMRVYFDTVEDGQHLSLSPSRLPSYEPAYVMTVHKSQGSEFSHTLLVMPLTMAPVLTKELLYTAVTRAKSQFTLFSDKKIWASAVSTQVQRQSGLREQLLAME